MPFNGSGTYSRDNGTHTGSATWADDDAAGINITTANHDVHDQDIADALSNVICKDGQTTITANLPMAGYRHTGVGDASARDHYATVKQLQDGSFLKLGSVGGTANAITANLTPAISAYVDGMTVCLTPTAAITGTGGATLAINGISGAKDIKVYHSKYGFVDVQQWDMVADVRYLLMYDSTEDAFILLNSSMPHVLSYDYEVGASLTSHGGTGWNQFGATQSWYVPKNSVVFVRAFTSLSINTGSDRLFEFTVYVDGSSRAQPFMLEKAALYQGSSGWETTANVAGRYFETTGGDLDFELYWKLTDSSTKYSYRRGIHALVFPNFDER
jgi:hypothetical protein